MEDKASAQLDASTSLFHAAWRRCRGHIEKKLKMLFRNFFVQKHKTNSIEGITVITANRLAAKKEVINEDLQAVVNKQRSIMFASSPACSKLCL